MPRYSFNMHGVRPSQDEKGEELPDDEAAWHEATLVAGEIFKDMRVNSARIRNGRWNLPMSRVRLCITSASAQSGSSVDLRRSDAGVNS